MLRRGSPGYPRRGRMGYIICYGNEDSVNTSTNQIHAAWREQRKMHWLRGKEQLPSALVEFNFIKPDFIPAATRVDINDYEGEEYLTMPPYLISLMYHRQNNNRTFRRPTSRYQHTSD